MFCNFLHFYFTINSAKLAIVAGIGVVAIAAAPAVGLGMVAYGTASAGVAAGTALGLAGGGSLAIGGVAHAIH